MVHGRSLRLHCRCEHLRVFLSRTEPRVLRSGLRDSQLRRNFIRRLSVRLLCHRVCRSSLWWSTRYTASIVRSIRAMSRLQIFTIGNLFCAMSSLKMKFRKFVLRFICPDKPMLARTQHLCGGKPHTQSTGLVDVCIYFVASSTYAPWHVYFGLGTPRPCKVQFK